MTIKLITDELERPLSRLPQQFQDSEVLKDIISIFVEELFELQTVMTDILDTMDIEKAEGYWLDVIGVILDTPRDGATDEEYRVRLNLEVYYNSSTGAAEYITSALRYMTGGESIRLLDTGSANLNATTDGISLDEGTVNELRQMLGASIKLTLKSTLDFDSFTTVDVDAGGTSDYTNPDTSNVDYSYYDDVDAGGWFQDYQELSTADITIDTALVGGKTDVFVNRNYCSFESTTTSTTDAAVGLAAVIDALPDVSATSSTNVVTVTGTAFTLYQLTSNTTMNPAWISDNGGVMVDIVERGYTVQDTNSNVPASEGLAP